MLPFFFFFFTISLSILPSSSQCTNGCDLAIASYYISPNLNLTYIASLFNLPSPDSILPYNNLTSKDSIADGSRIRVPFRCDCIQSSRLGRTFAYATAAGDTYDVIAAARYANLTAAELVASENAYPPNRIPDGAEINVTVSCSCGDSGVSMDYGLFETFPMIEGETLDSIGKKLGFLDLGLLKRYNGDVNFSDGKRIVFVPTKDQYGSYRPLHISSTKAFSGGASAGISAAIVIVLLGLGSYLYFGVYKRKKAKNSQLIPSSVEDKSILHAAVDIELTSPDGNTSVGRGFTVDKSVEFSYEELAKATNDFNMANKIGEGGFGAVYYAELRGEKAAIKKMDMKASREFLAELKVLTHVHHLNLVRLIGYCTESSLFLVYEFIENGNLSQHLHGSDKDPLEWSTRVQIALDSARGLEYIHEHTVPVYIHRDIKSANILLDKKFHSKVADFGLAKLTQQAGGMTQRTRLVGTFGYMSPEYAGYGEVSPKIDVYAFGVVLYELISAKAAIVKAGPGRESMESMGLVAMFEEALSQPDPRDSMKKLIDPRLGNNYPIDSVHKMALLAKACTQENPKLRPSMRTVVVVLMTLSSTTGDWDIDFFYENQALVNLASGR